MWLFYHDPQSHHYYQSEYYLSIWHIIPRNFRFKHHDRHTMKILIRVVNYVNSVSDMLSNGLINIVLEAFNLLFIIIFMFMVDVQMALVVLCGVPVLVCLYVLCPHH